MKNLVKLSIAILSLGALISTAQAATPGAYVGAGLGASRLDTPDQNLSTITSPSLTQSHSRTGVGGRVFAGYNFNQYIGIEAGVAHYANAKYKANVPSLVDASITYSLNAADLVAKAYLPLADSGFNLYALGGGAYVNSKVAAKGSVLGESIDASKTTKKLRPEYGVGVSYAIPQTSFTTNLELSRIQGTGDVKTSDSAIPTANLVTFNIAYNFG